MQRATTTTIATSRRLLAVLALGATALVASGCSASTGATTDGSAAPSSEAAASAQVVTLVTHDSFKVDEALIAKLKAEKNIELKTVAANSGAQMVSQLTLKKANPIGDAVYGIDTNVMGAVAAAGILEPVDVQLPESAKNYVDPNVPAAIPIDRGDVCLNYDIAYFKEKNLPAPASFEDLAKPEYKGLTVALDPGQSTTGMAFVTATVQKFGDGWVDYWKSLKANGVKVVPKWDTAYNVDFTAGEGKGTYPIVVSYASSPSYSVTEAGPATAAVLSTCYPQVEYAGVLANAANPQGAKTVIEWLLSQEVQADIPQNMYMYPIDASVTIPEAMAKYAPLPTDTKAMDSAQVEANRAQWAQQFSDIFAG